MELLETASSSRVPTTIHLRLLSPSTSFLPGHSLAAQRLPLTFTSNFRCTAVSNHTVSPLEVKKMDGEDSSVFELSSITNLSPLDGRYWSKVKDLAPFMSEYGLIHYRVLLEIKWLIMLSQIPEVNEVPFFSDDAANFLQGLVDEFSTADAMEVKRTERVTNHDVKVVEYFPKQKCQPRQEISKHFRFGFQVLEFFHFACTSEDINNLSHGLMLKEALNNVVFPSMDEVVSAICHMAKKYAHIPILSRTHGQPTSPTTLGKEMEVFAYRLRRERKTICEVEQLGKCAGAVGNYNAHISAYPHINWPYVAEKFVTSLGLSFNPYVTQWYPCSSSHLLLQFSSSSWFVRRQLLFQTEIKIAAMRQTEPWPAVVPLPLYSPCSSPPKVRAFLPSSARESTTTQPSPWSSSKRLLLLGIRPPFTSAFFHLPLRFFLAIPSLLNASR